MFDEPQFPEKLFHESAMHKCYKTPACVLDFLVHKYKRPACILDFLSVLQCMTVIEDEGCSFFFFSNFKAYPDRGEDTTPEPTEEIILEEEVQSPTPEPELPKKQVKKGKNKQQRQQQQQQLDVAAEDDAIVEAVVERVEATPVVKAAPQPIVEEPVIVQQHVMKKAAKNNDSQQQQQGTITAAAYPLASRILDHILLLHFSICQDDASLSDRGREEDLAERRRGAAAD
jgi:hypothetical protein